MSKRYRIVTDRWAGFEVQRRVLGVWVQVGGANTHGTVELAEAMIERCCRPRVNVVKEVRCP